MTPAAGKFILSAICALALPLVAWIVVGSAEKLFDHVRAGAADLVKLWRSPWW